MSFLSSSQEDSVNGLHSRNFHGPFLSINTQMKFSKYIEFHLGCARAHVRTHARAHTHTRTHTHARAHTHTHSFTIIRDKKIQIQFEETKQFLTKKKITQYYYHMTQTETVFWSRSPLHTQDIPYNGAFQELPGASTVVRT